MSAGQPAQASEKGVWDKVAECESGGDWHINTGNGYYGGLQFSKQTWNGFGGSGTADEHSKQEQIRIAQKVLKEQGSWVVCGLYSKGNGHESEPGGSSGPTSRHGGGDGGDDGGDKDGGGANSIPNPIPKTS